MAKPRFLIVDDDVAACETLSDIFQEKDYSVVTLNTGYEAIDMAKREAFDVALIDIKLPDMEGTILLKEFKKSYPEMECIIITGHASIKSTIEALKYGAREYFVKPLIIEEVLFRINEVLNKQRMKQELKESEERYRSLVESSTDAIVSANESGKIIQWNKAASRIFGYSEEEVLDKSITMIIPEKYSKFYNCALTVEFEGVRKNNSILSIEFSISVVKTNDARIFTYIIRDITERKRAEKEMKQINSRLHWIVKTIKKLSLCSDIKEFGSQMLEEFGCQMEADGGSLYLLEEDGLHLIHALNSEHVFNFIPYPLPGNSAFQHVLTERKPLIILNVEKLSDFSINWKGYKKGSLLIFPLLNREKKVNGLLSLHSKTQLPLIDQDREMGSIFASYACEALQTIDALTRVEQLKNQLQAENIYLQDEIKLKHNFEKIISCSVLFKKVLRKVEQVASTNATVLILGESGTGKELIARAIHSTSRRKHRPLVRVNCAVLPENLIESELFGHEKGAFTSAFDSQMGRFELADGGTIFLDEIGDLPLGLQAKLLRVLQDGEFERLGNPHTMKVNVRIIAATNRNLEQAVNTGNFREDLYYRLNVFPIKIPPLRKRKEDIPLLVKHFIAKYSIKTGKKIERIPKKAMKSLQNRQWSGNVRELENVIERGVILAKDSTLICDEQFDDPLNLLNQEKKVPTFRELEEFLIHKALKESNWVVGGQYGAAARLRIPISTLWDRIKKYGLKKA